MRAAYLLLLVAISTSGCAPEAQKAEKIKRGPSELDPVVINVAMLTFFDKTDWNTMDWTRGDFVVVRPVWASVQRPSFESELDSAIQWFSSDKSGVEEAARLKAIKSSIRKEDFLFDPGDIPDIKKLQFDERIVVSDVDRNFGLLEEIKLKNRLGKEGSIRAMGLVSPPAYSHDGRYASVSMTGVPWSIHSAHLTFFLECTGSNWKVIHVKAIFFV